MIGESFAGVIEAPAANTPRDGAPDLQCALPLSEARPIVVQLNVNERNALSDNFACYAQSSQGAGGAGDQQGFLRVQYGMLGARREIDVDLRTQTFQLPPSDYVQVGARRFNATVAGPTFGAIQCSCSIAPGLLGGDTLPPTHSTLILARDGADPNDTVTIPNGARFFQHVLLGEVPRDFTVGVSFLGTYVDGNGPSQYPAHPLWPLRGIGSFSQTYGGVTATDLLTQFYICP
jgi:hypothetical protein